MKEFEFLMLQQHNGISDKCMNMNAIFTRSTKTTLGELKDYIYDEHKGISNIKNCIIIQIF